jgi:hypothetical protein
MVDASSPRWIGISLPTDIVLVGYLILEDFIPLKEHIGKGTQPLTPDPGPTSIGSKMVTTILPIHAPTHVRMARNGNVMVISMDYGTTTTSWKVTAMSGNGCRRLMLHRTVPTPEATGTC